MKSKSLAIHCLVSAICGTACTSLNRPDAAISETVIESIVPVQPEQPWHLDNAWQTGGLGGSVLRSSSIEHVVRQADQPLGGYVASDDAAGHVLNVSTSHISDSPNDDTLSSEWFVLFLSMTAASLLQAAGIAAMTQNVVRVSHCSD